LTDVTLKGISINSLMTSANASPIGQQKAKYSSDVAAALGNQLVIEIQVGSTVKYRSTINAFLTTSSEGVFLPNQFVEPPTINLADALTTDNVQLVIRNATNTAIELRVPLKAGGGTGFLTASSALNGVNYVRSGGVVLRPPSTLDVGGSTGTAGTFGTAVRASMINPPGREGRVVHATNANWSIGYPQATYLPSSGWTVQIFPDHLYGDNTTLLPWMVYWDEATTAWGTPHVTNPSNRKVALHMLTWYTYYHFSDTNAWVLASTSEMTGTVESYDANFGVNGTTPAGDFPTAQQVTFSDGTKGARLINESGITSPSQVRMQHAWSKRTSIGGASRYPYLDAVASGFKARIEPVASAGGTADDVANARLLVWIGVDHYPATGQKDPGELEAIMQGRPTLATGNYKWFTAWVKRLPLDPAWLDSHPLPTVT
jgi:hypothetical protein